MAAWVLAVVVPETRWITPELAQGVTIVLLSVGALWILGWAAYLARGWIGQSLIGLGARISSSRIGVGPSVIRPEWGSRDQAGHWNGIHDEASRVEGEFNRIIGRVSRAEAVTIEDRTRLRDRIDGLDAMVAEYSDMWLRPGAYWEQYTRRRWQSERGNSSPGDPPWAEPLRDRIGYAIWWLFRNPASRFGPSGSDSWDGTLGTSWDGSRGDYGSWSELTG